MKMTIDLGIKNNQGQVQVDPTIFRRLEELLIVVQFQNMSKLNCSFRITDIIVTVLKNLKSSPRKYFHHDISSTKHLWEHYCVPFLKDAVKTMDTTRLLNSLRVTGVMAVSVSFRSSQFEALQLLCIGILLTSPYIPHCVMWMDILILRW